MYNLSEDLSNLTTIPTSALSKLSDKSVFCICNDVEESLLKEENVADIDLGIGTLQILVDGNDLKYRFIPSKTLDINVKNTVINKKNPLTAAVEESLVKRILNTYKNYL